MRCCPNVLRFAAKQSLRTKLNRMSSSFKKFVADQKKVLKNVDYRVVKNNFSFEINH